MASRLMRDRARWRDQLNEPSRVLAEALFHQFPDWMDFAEVYEGPTPYGGTKPGSLTVHIPSPVPGRDHSLGVTHRGDTFEAYYNYRQPFHPHEQQFIFAPGEEQAAAEQVVEWLADIVEERLVLLEVRAGLFSWSKVTGWVLITREELTERQKRQPAAAISWRGSLDGVTQRPEGD